MARSLPPRPTPPDPGAIAGALAERRAHDRYEDLSAQNQQPLQALERLRARDRERVALDQGARGHEPRRVSTSTHRSRRRTGAWRGRAAGSAWRWAAAAGFDGHAAKPPTIEALEA